MTKCFKVGCSTSQVPTKPRAQAEALQRLDVRAFGCLLEELIERCDDAQALHRIRDACLSDDPASRPRFDEIEHAIRDRPT